jgi:hypothetical protein
MRKLTSANLHATLRAGAGRAAAPQVLLPEKYLEVGLTPDEREVVINHPDLQPDSRGVGHIVFSPAQARHLAKLLLRKASECKP